MKSKTVFIYVNQGFTVRYLLGSNILKNITENVDQVVILSHNGDEKAFKEKFEGPRIKVEKARYEEYQSFISSKKLLRVLVQFRAFILNGSFNTKTIDDFRKIFIHEQGWVFSKGILEWIKGKFWNIFSIIVGWS